MRVRGRVWLRQHDQGLLEELDMLFAQERFRLDRGLFLVAHGEMQQSGVKGKVRLGKGSEEG